MDSIPIQGHIDEQHRLTAIVPGTVAAGPVTIWIAPATQHEDDSGGQWMSGIAKQWAQELGDAREDIYTLADGEPVDPAV